MTKTNTLVISVIVVVVLVGILLGIYGFMRGLQESKEAESDIPQAIVDKFRNELTGRAHARGPHPIEGFTADMLLDIFPGLEPADFDGAATGAAGEEGVHSFENGELAWERTRSQPITSAERTVSLEGYATFLVNLSERLSMPMENEADVTAIIDAVDIPQDIAEHIASKKDRVVVYTPRPLATVTSPLTVWGEARGTWYFEADFQLTLVDWDGRIIAESFASAVLDQNDPESTWMTENFVPFEGTIEFENPSFPNEDEEHFSRRGALIFQKANPQGLPENDDALEIPVLFEKVEQ